MADLPSPNGGAYLPRSTEESGMAKIVDLAHESPWQEIRSTPRDWEELGRHGLLRMLYHLQVVRTFEETVLQLESEGLVHGPAHTRSEEHTSELQSPKDLVCRLLLEKKK